jgi:hypothetical protein
MIKKLTLIFFTIALLGCSKKEPTYRLPSFEKPIITGYTALDEVGNYLYTVGKPNIKTTYGEQESTISNNGTDISVDYSSAYEFIVFPKPCINHLNIIAFSPQKSSTKKVWIVNAHYYTEETISNNLGFQSFNSGGTPLIQIEFTGNDEYLDVSSLPNGYYRIYLSVDDIILYDNLVVDKN